MFYFYFKYDRPRWFWQVWTKYYFILTSKMSSIEIELEKSNAFKNVEKPKKTLSTGGKILIGLTGKIQFNQYPKKWMTIIPFFYLIICILLNWNVKGGAAIGLSVICAPFVAPAFRKYCLPYVPATNSQISNILQLLQKTSREKLLDIGSGDGRIVIGKYKSLMFNW